MLEVDIMQKENEIEKLKLQCCSVEALRCIAQSQVAHESKERTKKYVALKAYHDNKYKEFDEKVFEYDKLKQTNQENVKRHRSHEKTHREEQSSHNKLKRDKRCSNTYKKCMFDAAKAKRCKETKLEREFG